MRLLLDTHVLLWTLGGDNRLGPRARAEIENPASVVYVSAASGWEIAIKASLGKVRVPPRVSEWLPRELARCQMLELPVTLAHALAIEHLPRHHEDPFDRLLVAQAHAEGLTLVTADRALRRYGTATLEA